MLNVDNLEDGRLYIVKTDSNSHWLFRKKDNLFITSRYMSICLNDNYIGSGEGYVCEDSQVIDIKHASSNYEAMWNRTFNDNVEMV